MTQPVKSILIYIDGEWKAGRSTFLGALRANQSDEFVVNGVIPITDELNIIMIRVGASCRPSYYQMAKKHNVPIVYLVNSSNENQVAYFGNSLGITQPYRTETIAGAIEMLKRLEFNNPFVIIANKQDLPDALPLEAICSILNIPEHIPVLPCIATERDSVKAVIIAVLKLLPQDDVVEQAIAKVESL